MDEFLTGSQWATGPIWTVVQVVAAALVGGGLVAWIQAKARVPLTKAEAADRLNDATLEWAEQVKTDAMDARREAREAREDAEEARRQIRAVRDEAEHLAGYLRWLVMSIHEPTMTIERLRTLVGDGPGLPLPPNGRAT